MYSGIIVKLELFIYYNCYWASLKKDNQNDYLQKLLSVCLWIIISCMHVWVYIWVYLFITNYLHLHFGFIMLKLCDFKRRTVNQSMVENIKVKLWDIIVFVLYCICSSHPHFREWKVVQNIFKNQGNKVLLRDAPGTVRKSESGVWAWSDSKHGTDNL